MTVLDAQAVVAALIGEPAAPEVERLLRSRDDRPRMSAVNLTEVVDILVRRRGVPEAAAIERIGWLEVGGLEVVGFDRTVALEAGLLRARQYDRDERPLSLADCAALATCLVAGDRLATSDPPLASAARSEGCDVIALPDTAGRRP